MGILDTILGAATKYAPLIKTGVAALSTYASFKDQQKKNQLQQEAYDDYMAQAEAAGHEARAAIDINYTPMTVSGVPTTKADVTDFTAVAARGGLMSIPNRQRKRYARGPNEFEVETMDEETITPFDLQMEEGVNIGEQVFHDTGNPMTNAKNVWESGAIDQDNYIDFNDFFQSGDWEGHISKVEVEGDMQMASAPDPMDERNSTANMLFNKNLDQLTETELIQLDEAIADSLASGGIAGLRHGGRPGYQSQGFVGTTLEEGDIGLEEQIIHPGTLDEGDIGMPGQATTEFEHEGSLATEPTSFEEVIEIAKRVPIPGNPYFIWETMKKAGATFAEAIEIVKNKFGGEEVIEESEGIEYLRHGGRPGYAFGPGPVVDQETMAESITLPDGGEEVVTDSMTEIKGQTAGGGDRGWKAQMLAEDLAQEEYGKEFYDLSQDKQIEIYTIALDMIDSGGNAKGGLPKRVRKDNGGPAEIGGDNISDVLARVKELEDEGLDFAAAMAQAMKELSSGKAQGGRIRKAPGGIMDLGGLEKDYRTTGGFVPIGAYEKKDDVPARLSKNEFVMTADAVRAAGGGSINKGAQRMYDTMKHLEASPQSQRMTA